MSSLATDESMTGCRGMCGGTRKGRGCTMTPESRGTMPGAEPCRRGAKKCRDRPEEAWAWEELPSCQCTLESRWWRPP